MGINHGGAHIAVPEKFLYGADVVAWFYQVSCKRMAESVAAGVFYGALHKGFVYMPAFFLTCQFVLPAVFLRKELLPFEFLAAWRIFWVKGIGKSYGSESFVQILLVNFSEFLNLFFQVLLDRLYVFDSERFSWNLFLNCDSAFAFLFCNENFIFFSQERLFFLKKQP